MIPLSRPFSSGKEVFYLQKVLESEHFSGNSLYTQKCHDFFANRFGFQNCLLTSSCTDALEMCALLLDLKQGDEVLVPSFTFVSTINAFVNYGAKPVFCDIESELPNISVEEIQKKITPKTKAIIVMHYAGISCDMEAIIAIAKKHNLIVIEDAALGLGSTYKDIPLGKWGDLATFSFHETKSVTCGEGGLLVINNKKFVERAEILWEKGTNRSSFLKGKISHYEWMDKGSSYLTSELHAAMLYSQLMCLDDVLHIRKNLWYNYQNSLSKLNVKIPLLSLHSKVNGSLFYVIFENTKETTTFIDYMKKNEVQVSSHYTNLHQSRFYLSHFDAISLPNSEKTAPNLVRLPLFYQLTYKEQEKIITLTSEYIISL